MATSNYTPISTTLTDVILQKINRTFGPAVSGIIADRPDSWTNPKPARHLRKQADTDAHHHWQQNTQA